MRTSILRRDCEGLSKTCPGTFPVWDHAEWEPRSISVADSSIKSSEVFQLKCQYCWAVIGSSSIVRSRVSEGQCQGWEHPLGQGHSYMEQIDQLMMTNLKPLENQWIKHNRRPVSPIFPPIFFLSFIASGTHSAPCWTGLNRVRPC